MIKEPDFYRAGSQTRNPKLVVFLIDESTSMKEFCGSMPKSQVVDTHVNSALHAMINLNNKVDGVKDRMFAAVLGYGGMDKDDPEIYPLFESAYSEYEQSEWILPLSAIQALSSAVVGDRKQFIQSTPGGWTPMAFAIKVAGTCIHDWIQQRLTLTSRGGKLADDPRFPIPAPVIMNITDGLPSDDDAEWGPVEQWVDRLSTGECYPLDDSGSPIFLLDGPPLLINVGTPMTDSDLPTLVLPTEAELPHGTQDPSVAGIHRLWRMASPLHPNLLRTAISKGLLPSGTSHVGRRLYVNAGRDTAILDQIFEFGTVVAPH